MKVYGWSYEIDGKNAVFPTQVRIVDGGVFNGIVLEPLDTIVIENKRTLFWTGRQFIKMPKHNGT